MCVWPSFNGDCMCLRVCMHVCDCVCLYCDCVAFVCVSNHACMVIERVCVCICMFVDVCACMVVSLCLYVSLVMIVW